MPEIVVISTITELNVSGENIEVKTSYQEDSLPDTLEARIAIESGIENGTSYKQGDGLIKMKNSPDHISFSLDENGNLILTSNTGDESNYSIDTDGNLIYTTIE